MTMPLKLSDTTQAHLAHLVAIGATESAHLEFKRELPTTWDKEAKKRFMNDLIAFANGGGGDIVFGIDEDASAKATTVVPQEFQSVDEEERRLQDFMLTWAEPRLQGVLVKFVPVSVEKISGHAIVIRVPQSWAGPHRSKLDFHFYVRDGARNRQLDIPEIRALFLRSDNQTQRMRDFRAERLAKIVTSETPVPLGTGPKLVVHAISTQAALGLVYLDPVAYLKGHKKLPAVGFPPQASPITLNLDGAFGPVGNSGILQGYTQQFRQGYFEAVWQPAPIYNEQKTALSGAVYETFINDFLEMVRVELVAYGVSAEIAVFVSLIGANHATLSGPSSMGSFGEKEFDRKDIVLPDVLIDSESSIGRGMRQAYDLICQAAGYEGSLFYNEEGEWQVNPSR